MVHSPLSDGLTSMNTECDDHQPDQSQEIYSLPYLEEIETSNDEDDESDMSPLAAHPESALLSNTTINCDIIRTDFVVHGKRPTVFMGEDGAEVTIGPPPSTTASRKMSPSPTKQVDVIDQVESILRCYSNQDAALWTTTKRSNRRKTKALLERPSNSLLDAVSENQVIEYPVVAAPNQNIAYICCNNTNLECLSDQHLRDSLTFHKPQKEVERMISTLLGDPSGMEMWCHGWQAWSYFASIGPNATCVTSQVSIQATAKDDLKRVLRNRAFDMNSRRQRLQTLGRNVSPFEVESGNDASPEETTTVPSHKRPNRHLILPRTRSLPIAEYDPTRRGKGTTLLPPPIISVWDSMQSCTQPLTLDGMATAASDQDGLDVFYDSDPEDFVQRTKPAKAKQPKSTDNEKGSPFGTPFNLIDLHDDVAMGEAVQEVLNGCYTLIWHCCDRARKSTIAAPLAVKAWFERGQQLQSVLIQPKLMWSPLRPPLPQENCAATGNVDHYCADLLDISRVVAVDHVDRNIYPLAKQSCSFYIVTLDQKLMFEAQSEAEKKWIVNGLKLMVARLGSKLLVEDHSVFDEYFTIPLESLTGHR